MLLGHLFLGLVIGSAAATTALASGHGLGTAAVIYAGAEILGVVGSLILSLARDGGGPERERAPESPPTPVLWSN